jgi:membrane fusion protein (multidrug efflux system)
MSTTQQPAATTQPTQSAPQPTQPAQPPAQPPTNNSKRKRMMTLLVIVILIAAIAYGLYYFLVARFHEDTDDAYVNGNVVQTHAASHRHGRRGQRGRHANRSRPATRSSPSITADAKRRAVEQAEATLAQTVRQVRGLFADDNHYYAAPSRSASPICRAPRTT